MLKVGLIGCRECQDKCWENKDFLAVREGSGVFKNVGAAELIGCFTCGGCPGKQVVDRARLLIKGGADIIALSSSIHYANDGCGCPYYAHIRKELDKQLKSVIIIDPVTNSGM